MVLKNGVEILGRGHRRVQGLAFSAEDFVDVQENQELLFEPDETLKVLIPKTGYGWRGRSNIFVGDSLDFIHAVDNDADGAGADLHDHLQKRPPRPRSASLPDRRLGSVPLALLAPESQKLVPKGTPENPPSDSIDHRG